MTDRFIIVLKLLVTIFRIALTFFISHLIFEGMDRATAEWLKIIGSLEEPEKFLFYNIFFSYLLTLIHIVIIIRYWKMYRGIKEIYNEVIDQKER